MTSLNPPTHHDKVFTPELDELINRYLSAAHGLEKTVLKNKIVRHCLPYVTGIARGLARRSNDPVDDLVQVGAMGLIKAIDRYNPLSGNKFKTYATYLITGEIRHYLRDKALMIKPPRQIYELYYRMNQIIQTLTESLGRTPTDMEIAEELQCPVAQVRQVSEVEQRKQLVSLDEYLVKDAHQGETQYIERLVDEKYNAFLVNQESRLMLEKALYKLKREHREVIMMTFYDDLSQSEIATQLGISQMQVSRRLRKALELLQQSFGVSHPLFQKGFPQALP